jgi:hypothetical protein
MAERFSDIEKPFVIHPLGGKTEGIPGTESQDRQHARHARHYRERDEDKQGILEMLNLED